MVILTGLRATTVPSATAWSPPVTIASSSPQGLTPLQRTLKLPTPKAMSMDTCARPDGDGDDLVLDFAEFEYQIV